MEESVNEMEPHQSFRSPPRRRRSTFFERRESFAPQPLSEDMDTNNCKKTKGVHEAHNENLIRYHDLLLKEKEQWKKEVTNRRNRYHDLRQQYQMALKAPSRSRISYSALSNEDIEFIKAKINISTLVESQKKLHESVELTKAMYRRVNELNNIIVTKCEKNVNKITEYIFENSTVEPME